MLERAMLIGYVQRMYADDELRVAYELVTTDRARALRIDDYGFAIGNPANLVAIEASEVAEAMASHAPRRLVLHNGRPSSLANLQTRRGQMNPQLPRERGRHLTAHGRDDGSRSSTSPTRRSRPEFRYLRRR